jgi:hypothetical protein
MALKNYEDVRGRISAIQQRLNVEVDTDREIQRISSYDQRCSAATSCLSPFSLSERQVEGPPRGVWGYRAAPGGDRQPAEMSSPSTNTRLPLLSLTAHRRAASTMRWPPIRTACPALSPKSSTMTPATSRAVPG